MATDLQRILELGRWAPSGDNTQPWRFEITGESEIIVHGFDTRTHCVYDLDGHPSQIAIGALLETLAIAATEQGLRMDAQRLLEFPDTQPTFRLIFMPDVAVVPSPLVSSIAQRSVQRRPMSTRRLSRANKESLAAALGDDYSVQWIEGSRKLAVAKLMFDSAKLRLTMPEAYDVHRDIIEWHAKFSADKVPDQALGIDPLTLRVMRFAMRSWNRVRFFNRYLAGTWAPRIQMDFLPGIACGAHFAIQAKTLARAIDEYVAAGRAVQRFWLTATHLGLFLQPELTPLIFARYARENRAFSIIPGMGDAARSIARRLAEVIVDDASGRTAFMGRVGHGSAPASRSLRRPLHKLLGTKPTTAQGHGR